MRHGSLFSGIGGFDLAAEWMGWENVFHCEYAEFPKKILKKHFPNAIGYNDIKTTDFSIHRGGIDVLSGGFPCQPYSLAGKRLGKDDERHLWPQMLRAIREIQPRYVVGENVRGLVSWSGGLVFDEVQSDLETEGFEVLPFILPACAVNAPHRRERVWIIAYSKCYGRQRDKEFQSIDREGIRKGVVEGYESNPLLSGGTLANAYEPGLEKLQCLSGDYEQECDAPKRNGDGWQNGPIESPVCRADDGIPDRVDRIKGLGNAIVPQVAYQIFKAIESYNEAAARIPG